MKRVYTALFLLLLTISIPWRVTASYNRSPYNKHEILNHFPQCYWCKSYRVSYRQYRVLADFPIDYKFHNVCTNCLNKIQQKIQRLYQENPTWSRQQIIRQCIYEMQAEQWKYHKNQLRSLALLAGVGLAGYGIYALYKRLEYRPLRLICS